MLDINLIRNEPEKVKKGIASKNADPGLVDALLRVDGEWRALTAKIDGLRAEQKKISKDYGKAPADATAEATSVKKATAGEEGKKNKMAIKELEEKLRALETERDAALLKIPNLPSDDTPVGKDETANKVIRVGGKPKKFDFKPKDHLELGEALGLIDVQTAAKVSGARFAYLKGAAAQLEFALVHYALATLTNPSVMRSAAEGVKPGYDGKPFMPVVPPVMIRPEVMQRMGRLEPKEERYHIPSDDLYLVGSAEHTLGPLHMDQIIPEKDLPIRYVGFSTSFRREAGSYGKDTRGILRVHQFDKVEMESFTLPEHSITEQDFFVAIQEYLMWSLELPYQVMICSTGDQGDPDARHIDINTWFPSEGKYRETHSADLMTDYQARRLNTKVRRADGKTEFVHMNDATVFAVGRTIAAVLENYQCKDGTVEIPKVLQKYVGKKIIE